LGGNHRLSHFPTSTPSKHTSHHHNWSIASRQFLTYKYGQPREMYKGVKLTKREKWHDIKLAQNSWENLSMSITNPLQYKMCFLIKLRRTLITLPPLGTQDWMITGTWSMGVYFMLLLSKLEGLSTIVYFPQKEYHLIGPSPTFWKHHKFLCLKMEIFCTTLSHISLVPGWPFLQFIYIET